MEESKRKNLSHVRLEFTLRYLNEEIKKENIAIDVIIWG